MLRARVPLLAAVAAIALFALFASAGRGSGGTYSLPSGNPVVSGTTITSSWANNTLNDISTELTNSLDRQGRGAMLAPLQLTNGTVTAPSLTFATEPTSGLYRNATNDVRLTVAASEAMRWQAAGITAVKPLTVTGLLTTTNLAVTSSADALTISPTTSPTNALTATGTANAAGVVATGGASSGTGIIATGGAPGGQGAALLGVGTGPGLVTAGGATSGTGMAALGGAPNGVGAIIMGAGSGNGVNIAAGTNATGGSRTTAARLANGDLDMDGVAYPTFSTAAKNRLTPSNIVKAWGNIPTAVTAANPYIVEGFNVASVTPVASAPDYWSITYAQPLTGGFGGAVVISPYNGGGWIGSVCVPQVTLHDNTHFQVSFFHASTGVSCTYASNTWPAFTFMVMGAQ